MMTEVAFRVLGDPATQGGTTSVPIKNKAGQIMGWRKVAEGGVNLKSWRQEVASEAERAVQARGDRFTGPVSLSVTFRFPMPKSRPKWAHLQRILLREGKPDLDKLVRAIGDSLKVGGLLTDDAQIVEFDKIRKVEVHDSWIGASIKVCALDQRAFWQDDR